MRTSGIPRAAKLLAAALLFGLAGPGCKDQRDGEGSTAALTVPLPAVTQFAVLAARSASIGDRSSVAGGDVGVAAGATNSLTAGMDSRVGAGAVVLAPVMTLRDRAAAGEIGATQITVGAGVTTGPRSAYVAPPAAPALPVFTAGTNAVTVDAGQTQALAAGDHGAVTVNGTLNLSGGTYEMQSLRLGPGARVTALAASVVRIQTGLAVSDRAALAPGGALNAGALRLIVNGTIDGNVNSAALGTDVVLTAIVVARNVFRTGDRFVGTGAISAQDVIVANDSRLTFAVGFGCDSAASCNDNNPCTTDACVDAACTHTNAPNGTACSDGNGCTRTDTCQAGSCTGANPVVCAAADACHLAGVCNPATGLCSNPNAPDGTACNDNNACTQTSACQAGACTGANPVVCAAADACHLAGVCNPATGVCSNPNAPDGTACNDNNICTRGDACRGGTCSAAGSIVTEYAAGVPQPRQITPGPDGNLWFISTEATPGVGAVARIVPASGAVTAFPTTAAPRSAPLLLDDIVAGPDGNLWFTGRDPSQDGLPAIGSIAPSGTFIVPDLLGSPGGTIITGPDGNLWTGGSFLGVIDVVFRSSAPGVVIPVSTTPHALATGPDANVWLVASDGSGSAFVGRVIPGAPGEEIASEFPVTTSGHLNDIAAGPDGNLWFTDAGNNEIGRISTAGVITKFAVPTAASGVHGIVAGPDGNLWFTENVANKIARITVAGAVTELACIPTANSGPTQIAVGADGRLWLTETGAGKIAAVQLP